MKVILLTTHHHIAACTSIKTFLKNTLLKKHGIEVVGIIAANPFKTYKKQFKKFGQLFKKSGYRFAFKFLFIGFIQLLSLKIARIFQGEKNRKYFEIDELATKYKIPFLRTKDINDEKSQKFIEEKEPDYLVSCGLLQLVKKNILALPKEGALNFHPSLVQEHRGTFTSFWALFRRKKTSGATVHFMTEKFDDGDVIIQRNFLVKKCDTLYSIDDKSARLGGNLLVKALVKLKKKKAKKIFIQNLAKLLSVPSRQEVALFKKHKKKIFTWTDITRILGLGKLK